MPAPARAARRIPARGAWRGRARRDHTATGAVARQAQLAGLAGARRSVPAGGARSVPARSIRSRTSFVRRRPAVPGGDGAARVSRPDVLVIDVVAGAVEACASRPCGTTSRKPSGTHIRSAPLVRAQVQVSGLGKALRAGTRNRRPDARDRPCWFPARCGRCRPPRSATGCRANGCSGRSRECRGLPRRA